uniref:hypothetical protein n=1 Tax=Nosocomiicoccus ampullae TaxID=489910 RepID=UPI000B28339B
LSNINIKTFEEFEYNIFKLDEYPNNYRFVKTSYGDSSLMVIDSNYNTQKNLIENQNKKYDDNKTIHSSETEVELVETEKNQKNIKDNIHKDIEEKIYVNPEVKRVLFNIVNTLDTTSYSIEFLYKRNEEILRNNGINTISQLEKGLKELSTLSKFFELHSSNGKYFDYIRIGENKSHIYKLSVVRDILDDLKVGTYTLTDIYDNYFEVLEFNAMDNKMLLKTLLQQIPSNINVVIKNTAKTGFIVIVRDSNNIEEAIENEDNEKVEQNDYIDTLESEKKEEDLKVNEIDNEIDYVESSNPDTSTFEKRKDSGEEDLINEKTEEDSENVLETSSDDKVSSDDNIVEKESEKLDRDNTNVKVWLYSVLDNLNPGRFSLNILFVRHHNYLTRAGITSIEDFLKLLLSLEQLPKFIRLDTLHMPDGTLKYFLDVSSKRSKTYRYNVLNALFKDLKYGSYSVTTLYKNHSEHLNEHGIENIETLKKLLREYHNNKYASYHEINNNYGYVKINLNKAEEVKKTKTELKKIDFKENIYTYDDMKSILKENKLSMTNLKDYGFAAERGVVYSTDLYDDVEEAIIDYLGETRIIRIKNNKILNTVRGKEFVSNSLKNFDLLHYSSDVVINNYVDNESLKKDVLIEFIEFIKSLDDIKYFTVPLLLEKKYDNRLLGLGYPIEFYEQILINSDEFHRLNRSTPYLFYKRDEGRLTFADFYMDQILVYNKSVDIYDFIEDTKIRTGFEVDRLHVIRELENQDIFYSRELERFYLYAEDYYKEIYR